ncbi:hypothetical protein ABLA76_09445 [Xenorhabdus sp. SGI240]
MSGAVYPPHELETVLIDIVFGENYPLQHNNNAIAFRYSQIG